jgi:prenyltransferase beta subunit
MEGRGLSWSVWPPEDCISRLEQWLTGSQNQDGGWGKRRGEPSTGSATAVGLKGLSWVIRMRMGYPMQMDHSDKDVRIQKAYAWIRRNVNPANDGTGGKMTADQRVYCLRRAADSIWKQRRDAGDVVERAVQHILDHQDADGGWGTGREVDERTWETCRAILALRMN